MSSHSNFHWFATKWLVGYNANMEFLRFKPVALWRMDDTTPLQDYSGYSRSGVITGTETHGISLSCYAAYSQYLSSAITATFASPVFVAGMESAPFSVHASIYAVRPVTATNDPQQILSNSGKYDGLIIEGTKISFSTAYVSTGEAKCSYDMQVNQNADVVGVHTYAKNMLFVNGVQVAEVDITEAQKADTFDAPDTNLYSGLTTQSAGLLMNTVALYSKALTSEEVMALYVANNKRPTSSVPKMFGGEDVLISTAVRPTQIAATWTTDADWNAAIMTNCAVEDGRLVPQMINEETLAGTWNDSVSLYTGETAVTLQALNMDWNGENVTVEASVDNTTWITVTKGVNLSIIPAGFDPAGKSLYVRVTFAGGLESAFIDSLQVRGFTSTTATPLSGRTRTYGSAVVTCDEYPALDLNDNWGIKANGGTITISADPGASPLNPMAIELWIKQGSGAVFTRNFTVIGTYVNGIPGSTSFPVGRWVAVQFNVAAAITGSLIFGGDVQIGKVAFYPANLTNQQAADLYASYVGSRKVTYAGTGTIALAEPSDSAKVYAHDWEIVAA